MPSEILEVGGLEDLPGNDYGVQPIWRVVAAEPTAVIEYGPPRLTGDDASPGQVVVPPEERIHSLASLQRDGLITSDELELAVEQLLGARALPEAETEPRPKPETPGVPGSTTSPNRRRLLFAYAVAAVVLILALVVASQFAGRLLFARQPAAHTSSSPTLAQPSPSPTPSAVPLNLQSILIKLTDLRSGYVAGPYDSSPLCGACVPSVGSLSVVFQNRQLNRSIITGASVALTAADSGSVLQALMSFRSKGHWAKGTGLGDESYTATNTAGGLNNFYVVWRSGVVTDEIVLGAPSGTLTLQNAIDLAKVQQVRAAAALAGP